MKEQENGKYDPEGLYIFAVIVSQSEWLESSEG